MLRFLLASAVPALLCLPLAAAESPDPLAGGITLSAEQPGNGSAYSGAEILPVPDHDGTVFALRAGTAGELHYRFSLTGVNLVSLLGTLSQTLYDEFDTAQIIRHGERLTVWDDTANLRYIDISVNDLTLTAVLDAASIASDCNLFVENRTIIVDQCD